MSRLRGCGPWLLVGVALLAALVGVLAVSFAISAEDDEAGRAPAAPASLPAPGAGSEAAGAADEVDDVGPCQLEDPDTVLLEVVNNSSRQSSYVIDVNYLDAAGNRVGDESFFVSFVRSGETARQAHHVFDDSGGVDCSVAEVERFAAESPDDIAEVPCRVEGVGPLGNIRTEFIATNRSSGLSDYFFTAALVRDGVRVGAAIGSIENVPAGQSAPGDGFTTVSGPADGVECQTVHVQRTASG